MADLNLIPNPSVLAVNTGIFIANLVVVRKLFVEPYLAIRKQREEVTTGTQDGAQQLEKMCEEAEIRIRRAVQEAVEEAKQVRATIKAEAMKRREENLQAAEEEAKKILDDVMKGIRTELESERERIPEVIERLSDQLFQAVVPEATAS